jgi:hypothetical protein
MQLELFTASYRDFDPSMGVPVRTSRGYPRFWKLGRLQVLREAMPERAWMTMTDPAVFGELYRQKLDDVGAHVLLGRLEEIAAAAGDRRLVLLCFENLEKPGAWCHRSALGRWFEEQTGVPVPEVGQGRRDPWVS